MSISSLASQLASERHAAVTDSGIRPHKFVRLPGQQRVGGGGGVDRGGRPSPSPSRLATGVGPPRKAAPDSVRGPPEQLQRPLLGPHQDRCVATARRIVPGRRRPIPFRIKRVPATLPLQLNGQPPQRPAFGRDGLLLVLLLLLLLFLPPVCSSPS